MFSRVSWMTASVGLTGQEWPLAKHKQVGVAEKA